MRSGIPPAVGSSRALGRRAFASGIASAALLLWVASPVGATVTQVSFVPAAPTACDSVSVVVAGELPSSCYQIVGVTLAGPAPEPCMRMTPCPLQFSVDITVREPNPLLEMPCSVATPYTRSFAVGRLAAGDYVVGAIERVIPFAADSTDSVVSETFASALTSVHADSVCVPGSGCYLLSFTPDLPTPRAGSAFCTAQAPPGGTACLDLFLANSEAVGGLQTTLEVGVPFGPVTSSSFLHAASVVPLSRAGGFSVGWTAEGSSTKILLYSTAGAVIPRGEGPVARVCYSVAPETPTGVYRVASTGEIVGDSLGGSVPPCPTLAPIAPGTICVGSMGCDVNGDGVSDVLDVIDLVRCALASGNDSVPACPDSVAARADCNGDGSVDIRDVICCVRRIVHSLGAPAPAGIVRPALAQIVQGNAIGFEGTVRWIDAVDGVAVVRMDTAPDWGGAQFSIDPSGTGVRIRDMKLLTADARDQLEWALDGAGIAHAIVFTTAGTVRAAGSDGIEVLLERAPGGSTPGVLRLSDVRAGTRDGAVAPVSMTTASLEITGTAPTTPILLSARPNPTSGQTEIGFALPAGVRVALRVYDVAGRLVRTLAEGTMTAGVHRVRWDGLDAQGRTARSGIYFAKLEVGATIRSGRILLMR